MLTCLKEHGVYIFIVCIAFLITFTIIANAITSLQKEKINPSISSLELLNKKFLLGKEYICCDESIKVLPNKCFAECQKLKRIDFKGDILFIESDAFFGCVNVEEINFYGKVQYYSNSAFQKLTNLKRIYFKDLPVVYANAFANLTSLKSITIENNLREIEEGAFFNCHLLKNFKADGVKVYLTDESKRAVVISKNIDALKPWTFSFCDSIEKVVIHENVIAIDPHCFSACKKIEGIVYFGTIENFKKIYPSFAIELSSDCLIKTADNLQGVMVGDLIKNN